MRLGGWVAVALGLLAASASVGQDASAPVLLVDPGSHLGRVNGIAWTPDGRELVTCSDDSTARVWDAANGDLRALIRMPYGNGVPCSLAISPDGRWLAVSLWANSVRLYDLPTRRLLRVLPTAPVGGLTLRFSPDGRMLACAGETSRQVVLWATDTWREVGRPVVSESLVHSVTFSADSKELACGSDELVILSLPSLAVRLRRRYEGDWLYQVDWTGDGQHLLLTHFIDGASVIVNAASGKELGRFGYPLKPPCLRRDGTFWASDREGAYEAAWPERLRLYTADGGTAPAPVLRMGETADQWALSPDETMLAIARSNGTVRVYSLDGEQRWGRQNPMQYAPWLAIGGDGAALAFQGNGRSATWLADPGRLMPFDAALPWRTSTHDRAGRRLISNGGQLVVRRADDTPVWDIQKTHNGATLLGDGRVVAVHKWHGVVFSADGQHSQILGSRLSDLMAPAATDDGRLVAASSAEGTISVWSLNDQRPVIPPLLNLYPTTSDNWVAWTEEGYYACTPGAEQWIGWQINQGDQEPLFYHAAQFRDKFYRPDIIRRVLKCGSVAKAVEEADAQRNQKTDPKLVAAQLASFAPPRVTVTAPADGAVVTESKIIVRATIKDPNGRKIASAQVMVNGRAPWQGRFVFVPVRGPEEYAGPVELNPGENVISVTATNDAGAQTAPVSITVKYEAPEAEVTKPALYVLAVGVGDYAKPEYKLALAGKDAKDFAAAYQGQAGRLFRKVDVKLLADTQASQDNILDGLDWLSKQVTQRDYAVVYLAGHGLPDTKGDFYFLPSDGDAEKLLRTGVSWQAIRGVLKNLPGKVLLFLDACHSGGAAGTRLVGRLDYTNALRDAATDEVGVITLASCMPSEVSYERPEWGNGAFTKALVEGLAGKADLSGDGVISVAELDAFVAERVKELTEGRQHPTTQRPTTIRSSMPVAAVGR